VVISLHRKDRGELDVCAVLTGELLRTRGEQGCTATHTLHENTQEGGLVSSRVSKGEDRRREQPLLVHQVGGKEPLLCVIRAHVEACQRTRDHRLHGVAMERREEKRATEQKSVKLRREIDTQHAQHEREPPSRNARAHAASDRAHDEQDAQVTHSSTYSSRTHPHTYQSGRREGFGGAAGRSLRLREVRRCGFGRCSALARVLSRRARRAEAAVVPHVRIENVVQNGLQSLLDAPPRMQVGRMGYAFVVLHTRMRHEGTFEERREYQSRLLALHPTFQQLWGVHTLHRDERVVAK
jgi:hypothetical protein